MVVKVSAGRPGLIVFLYMKGYFIKVPVVFHTLIEGTVRDVTQSIIFHKACFNEGLFG